MSVLLETVVMSATEGHAMVAKYRQGTAAYINYTLVPVVRSSSSCLSFWYYMFAGPVGSLVVYINTDVSTQRRRVWERQVNLGGTGISGRWLQGEIQLSADVLTLTEVPTSRISHPAYKPTPIFTAENLAKK